MGSFKLWILSAILILKLMITIPTLYGKEGYRLHPLVLPLGGMDGGAEILLSHIPVFRLN